MLGYVDKTFSVLLLLLLAPGARPAEIADDSQLTSLQLSAPRGDRLYQLARFEDAEAAYSEAVDLDRNNVRGHLGLGRIATMLSETQRAVEHFSAAYQIAPRDPNAILAFAGVVENAQARLMLLRNFLALSTDARAEDVRAKLRIAERMGATRLSVLKSPYRSYRIPLSNIGSSGLLLRARINGGEEVRLIVDSGASGIVLNASAASRFNLEFLAGATLTGFGASSQTEARVARANSFQAGELIINDSADRRERNESESRRRRDDWSRRL